MAVRWTHVYEVKNIIGEPRVLLNNNGKVNSKSYPEIIEDHGEFYLGNEDFLDGLRDPKFLKIEVERSKNTSPEFLEKLSAIAKKYNW